MELNIKTCPPIRDGGIRSLPALGYNKNSIRFNIKAVNLLGLPDKSISRISFKIDGANLMMKWDAKYGFPVIYRSKGKVYCIHNRTLIKHFTTVTNKEKGLLFIGDFKDGYYHLNQF